MSIATVLPRVMQDGRTVPTAEAHQLLLELLQLKPGEKVLEIGTGSGTTAGELSQACCSCECRDCFPGVVEMNHGIRPQHCGKSSCTQVEVHSIELEPVYGEVLDPRSEHVYFHKGDGKLGLEKEAPFDAIVATCGVERVPDIWQRQLHEGGRLVCPLGTSTVQRLVLMKKQGGLLRLERVRAYVRFSMMR